MVYYEGASGRCFGDKGEKDGFHADGRYGSTPPRVAFETGESLPIMASIPEYGPCACTISSCEMATFLAASSPAPMPEPAVEHWLGILLDVVGRGERCEGNIYLAEVDIIVFFLNYFFKFF